MSNLPSYLKGTPGYLQDFRSQSVPLIPKEPSYLTGMTRTEQTPSYITGNQRNTNTSKYLPSYLSSSDITNNSTATFEVPTPEPTRKVHTNYSLEEIKRQQETLAAFGFAIEEEDFLNQKPKLDTTQLPDLLLFIQQDPRYKRLLFKYAPPVSFINSV